MRAWSGRNGFPFAIALALSVATAGTLVPERALAETADSQDNLEGPHSLVGSYLAGRMARDQNEADRAASFYLGALEHDPGNALLLEQAFLMEAMEGASPAANKLAEQLIAADPQYRTAHLFLGLRDFKAGSFKSSEQHFRAASTGPIGELTGSMALAWVKLAENDTAGALAQLDAPKQADWAQFYLRYHRALVADLGGRKADSRAAFDRVFKQDAKALRMTLAYARSAAHAGDAKLARSVISEHVEKSQGENHPLLRELQNELGANAKSARLIETPAQGLAEAFYGLGEALIGEGAVSAGVLYMQMALSVAPEHEFALAALANAHESVKRFDDALAVYNRIPKDSALALPVEIRRAYNLNSLDRADEARQALQALLERMKPSDGAAPPAAEPAATTEPVAAAEPAAAATPGLPLALGSRGDAVSVLQGHLRELGYKTVDVDGFFGETTRKAVQSFQKKNKLEADGMAGVETLALIEGDEPPTIAPSEKPAVVASAAPTASQYTAGDQLQVLDALGSIQRSRKMFAEAVETYTKTLGLIPRLDKRHWPYFYARGTSYERLKNWPAAEADLKKALELAPGEPLVLNYLGYSWVDQGLNLKEGMSLIEKAVALKPDDGYIVDSLGWAHFKIGNYREAVRYMERAVELRPDDPILNDHLGDALWKVGREREARFQWDQALSLSPEPEDAVKIKAKLAEGLQAGAPVRAGSLEPEKTTPPPAETPPAPPAEPAVVQ
jgi:tetratricopeptide (TPR) repeat protein